MKSKEAKEIEKYLEELDSAIKTMYADLKKMHKQIEKIKDGLFRSNHLSLSDHELVHLFSPDDKKLVRRYEKLNRDRSELINKHEELTKELETLQQTSAVEKTSSHPLHFLNPFAMFKKSASMPDNLQPEDKKLPAKNSSMPNLKRKP